ncbi:MAG: DUF29 domain-containing protein [Gemmataceae bacterium]|nr:DUF29 domain-containing protein [Gemmataceae bacterium]
MTRGNRTAGGAAKRTRSQAKQRRAELTRLYEADETAWLEEMSRLIREGRLDEADTENLSGYLLDMAKRDRREVVNRLTTLIMHVLKSDHQPRKRSRSWQVTILTQKDELQDLLESQTLKNHAAEVLGKAYARAVKYASEETGLPADRFPNECPYTLDELLS